MKIEFSIEERTYEAVSMNADDYDSDDMVLGVLEAGRKDVPFEIWHAGDLTFDNIARLQRAIGMLKPERRPKIFRILFFDDREVLPITKDYIRMVFEGL